MPWVSLDDNLSNGFTGGYRDVTVNLPLIGANSELDHTQSLPGAAAGMGVIVQPPALEAGLGLTLARIQGTDQVNLRVRNFTAGAIDPASATWRFWLSR